MKHPQSVFSQAEIEKVKLLLEMSVKDGLIFPNWEFSILTGAKIEEARATSVNWPDVDLLDEGTLLTLRGVLGNMIGYPHKQGELIYSRTALNPNDLRELRNRLDQFTHILS